MPATLSDLDAWLRRYAATIHDQVAYLTELDAAVGDADHGTNMDRGMQKVVGVLDSESFEAADALFKKVGMTLVSAVGGASGPLYGTFFLRVGTGIGTVSEVDAETLGAGLRAGVEGVLARGKAELGDKTMYDAWAPALEAYDGAEGDIGDRLTAAADAAAQARDDTAGLVARKGRASYLGERSAGHVDPGAASTVMLLEAARDTLS
ncbi:dihydroxyacetone kinase subunit DhaL [Solicola gregarius]|uniref:Dihydroxyacetone kinase subunit L n=1 Tax=Solicola gregarius TaxID=2908642 RepID=A0AA46TG28_9ACTN|nr:dihydroxyacetone kinase subunit DhaL [Solicola gregarius]UYM04704.1 dihydroxyacetone kinase subunit L [Solicola gregarius]